jgi:AcrR family transcriptional regulator
METRKRPTIKLTGGPHGIPRAVVHEVQRGRLLDAMAEVIADEGYLDTTVHKILTRARISRRTYYELFKDKEDCFLVAYDEAVEYVLALIERSCSEGTTPEAKVENGLQALLEFCRREPKVARMIVVEVMAAGANARARRVQTMEQLTTMVANALGDRGGVDREALLRARFLTGGVHELVYDALARGRTDGLSNLAEEVVASHLSSPPEAVHGH